jgi:hypothetical protein
MLGSGTLGDPYIIQNATDLQNVELDLDAYYELGASLNMVGVDFTPIGYSTPFSGNFNGQSYAISNLHVELTGAYYSGLFSQCDNAMLSNITITNFSDILDASSLGLGALVGYCRDTNVDNCHSSGMVTGYGGNVGGLIGYSTTLDGAQTISDSSSSCDVISGQGFIGYFASGNSGAYQQATISRCFATGDVTDGNGGFVGSTYSPFGTIEDCHYSGNITRALLSPGRLGGFGNTSNIP